LLDEARWERVEVSARISRRGVETYLANWTAGRVTLKVGFPPLGTPVSITREP
jgi:hypothetical protein